MNNYNIGMITLGEALKNEREIKKISLEQIYRKTNISIKNLKDMENNHFENFHNQFYFQNYLKNFLNAIGADEKTFYQTYKNILSNSPLKNQVLVKDTYKKIKYSRFKKNRLLIYMIVGILPLIIWATQSGFVKTIRLKNILGKPPALELPPGEIELPTYSLQYSSDYAPIRVKLVFQEETWIQAFRGSTKIIEKMFPKSSSMTLNGYNITFTIGNPSAVQFFLNDKEILDFKSQTKSLRFFLDPTNIQRFFKP